MIQLLRVCEWRGDRRIDHEAPDPTWEEVEKAIRTLNNRDVNDVYLSADAEDDEEFLCIGGGDGRYVVTGAFEETFPTVVDPGRGSGEEPLVVGGQEGSYPSRMIVSLDVALRAARSYYESGTFGGGGLVWELE
jgi:hypothetical protein